MAVAIRAGRDGFVCDLLVDPKVNDIVKIETVQRLCLRNKGLEFGIVIADIYRKVGFDRLEVGREKRAKFVAAHALCFARLALLGEGDAEHYRFAAQAIYATLEKEGELSLVKDAESLACAMFLTAVATGQADARRVLQRMNADAENVAQILNVLHGAFEKEQAEGLACGADLYLTKPFSISVLQASVSRLLESRKTLKDFFSSPESAYSSVDGHLVHQSDKEFMQSVLEILPKHITTDEAFSMESLASDLGMTARGFYRKFKKISGKTPSEFIKDYRFEMAASLLKSTGLTVQEIMYKVGISNKSYFYREFVSKYGMKPREYRQVH